LYQENKKETRKIENINLILLI